MGFNKNVPYFIVARCSEKNEQEKNTHYNQKRTSCINIRSFKWRRGVFTDEQGSKKREGAERWYMFNKKIWKSFERTKQKDHKHSLKTGRVVKKIQGQGLIFWLRWSKSI